MLNCKKLAVNKSIFEKSKIYSMKKMQLENLIQQQTHLLMNI